MVRDWLEPRIQVLLAAERVVEDRGEALVEEGLRRASPWSCKRIALSDRLLPSTRDVHGSHATMPPRIDTRVSDLNHGFAGWDGSVAAARALQDELAGKLVLRDEFPHPLRVLGGFDVGFEEDGAITRAAAVLLDANTLKPFDMQVARVATSMPYVPGLLSFRELPALLEVLDKLPRMPDLAFVDGHGIAHPRSLGIAAHFGIVSGLPTIGVAKKILCGQGPEPHQTRGAYTALRRNGKQIGWILRSKVNCNPLIVSPGHRVAMGSVGDAVMRCVTTYRLPEPTRLADRLASRRDER